MVHDFSPFRSNFLSQEANPALDESLRRTQELSPPGEYVHESQSNVDEGAEDRVPADRAAALIEAHMETAAEFKRKPQTPIEERRKFRFQEKQRGLSSDK